MSPSLGGAPKLKAQETNQELDFDDGEIPIAVPKEKKPQKP